MTSIDGGLRWRSVMPRPFAGSTWAAAAFSFAGRRHGWLLLQGEGLLRSAHGPRWAVLGKLAA
jgi:hypothetical protein